MNLVDKRIMKKVLVIIKSNTKKSDNFSLIYKKCLKQSMAQASKVLKTKNYYSIEDIKKIFTIYYNKVFANHRNDCMISSLSLHFALYVFGHKNILYVGVERFPFSSHAWVEDLERHILNSEEYLCMNRNIILKKRL